MNQVAVRMVSNKNLIVFGRMWSNVLAKIIGNVFPFLAIVMIINMLSIKDFGTFSLFLSFLAIFGGLSFGIQHVYQRYVASYAEEKTDLQRVVKLTLTMFALRLCVFCLLLVIIYTLKVLSIFNPHYFDFPYIALAVVTTGFVISKYILRGGLLLGYLDHKFYNFFDCIITILKVLLIFFIRPTSIVGFIYIWLYLEIARVTVLFFRFSTIFKRDLKKCTQGKPKRLEYKRFLSYGKYFVFATIASQILAFDIDHYFLSYFKGNELVGLYSFATKIAFVIVGFAPVNILFNIVTPMIAKEYEKNRNIERIRNVITTLFKLNIFVYSAVALFLCINVYFIINTIFQTKYLVAVPYIYTLVAISLMPVIKNTFEPVARGIEKSGVYFYTFVAAVLNIIGNTLLIPRFGITGAVVSTGIAISLQSCAFVVFAYREIKFSFEMRFLSKLFVNLAPVVVLGFLLQRYLVSVASFVFINLLLVGVFLLFFKYNRCFSGEESSFINSFLPRRLFIF